jgi:hypothetical protein
MSIAVEIYDERELCPETLTVEPDAEAQALIDELGLKRQVEESGGRVAYPKPTVDQAFIIAILFPTATRLDNYDAGAIPLRVLKEIRSYRAENPTHRLIICHSSPAQVKDPILLACTGPYHWTDDQAGNMDDKRLVARWGDGLESWDALMERAQRVMAKGATDALENIIAKAQTVRDLLRSGQVGVRQIPKLTNMPDGW